MKNIIIILALLLACNSALAQTGSQKSAAALTIEVNTLLLTNGQNEINAYSLRQVELDIIASTIGVGGFPLVIGSTQLLGATQGSVLYANNNGTLGNIGTVGSGSVVLSSSPNISNPVITGTFTAIGLVTNVDLQNPATTVNGVTCTLGASCNTYQEISCPLKANNTTDDSTAWASCITTANTLAPNVSIVVPIGISIAPTLQATITGYNVWIRCAGAPGTCILKAGSNNALTWQGSYGGAINMGFDNSGANTNVTNIIGDIQVSFIDCVVYSGIGTFASTNGGLALIYNMTGTVGAHAPVPFLSIGGNGTQIYNSNIAAPYTTFTGTRNTASQITASAVAGTITIGDVIAGIGIPLGTTLTSQISGTTGGAGVYATSVDTTALAAAVSSMNAARDFIATTGNIDTIIVADSFTYGFSHPYNINAANGINIHDIFSTGNIFDVSLNGHSFIAQSGGIVAGVTLNDQWVASVGGGGNCISFSGAGLIESVRIDQFIPLCGSSGVSSTVSGTFKDITVRVQNDGVNSGNFASGIYGIYMAGGSGYSNITIDHSRTGQLGVSSSYQPQYGCAFGAAITGLNFDHNACYGSTANYNGMILGTGTDYAHSPVVQLGNLGLPDYINSGGNSLNYVASDTGTGPYFLLSFMDPNIANSGAGLYSLFGVAASANNSIGLGFLYTSAGSASNFGQLAVFGGTTAIKWFGSGAVTLGNTLTVSGIASAAQADVVCTTSAGLLTYQVSATGCAASSERFKDMRTPMGTKDAVRLSRCLNEAKRWTYKDPNFGDPSEYIGFTAEQVAVCDDRFITRDVWGLPYAVKHQQLAEALIVGLSVEVNGRLSRLDMRCALARCGRLRRHAQVAKNK
jgi:hypothetical protein